MKKLILLLLLLSGMSVCASEVTEDYFDMASDYCVYGNYDDALVYLDKILYLEPNNFDANNLKNTILRLKRTDVLPYLASTNPSVRKALKAEQIGDKKGELNALLEIKNDFWGCFLLGEYYRKNNDLTNSVTYYQKAVNLKPNYSQTYLSLAAVYLEQKNYQDAIEFVNKYISYNPESSLAYALRAEANLNLNRLLNAKSDISKALEIEENISYLLTEAKILYYQGKYEDAKFKLKMLSRNVQTSEVYELIGLCDYAQKDYTSALLNIDKAIILSDDDKDLNFKYNEIKNKLDNKND